MKRTTLCYIKKEYEWLLLYRNKKPHDPNAGKWIGIGGRIEEGETPDECNRREVLEETGIELRSAHFHGVISFRSDEWEDEDMYLYSAEFPADVGHTETKGQPVGGDGNAVVSLSACDEGDLAWIAESELFDLPMWEGDRLFLQQIIEGRDEITMTLRYEGEKLVNDTKNKET